VISPSSKSFAVTPGFTNGRPNSVFIVSLPLKTISGIFPAITWTVRVTVVAAFQLASVISYVSI
jgi:hypothetical protein